MSIPRKMIRRCFGIVQKIRIAYYEMLSSDISIQGILLRRQPLLIVGFGRIAVKGKATIGYFPSPYYYNTYAHFDLRKDGAAIEIGNGVIINNNASLIADGVTISIGDDTLIGLNFTVMTSDAHALHPDQRGSSLFPRKDVRIGRNVFIGNNVTVLKGANIGDNSVIGNGSVVVKDIPENVIAAGLPCRVIRSV